MFKIKLTTTTYYQKVVKAILVNISQSLFYCFFVFINQKKTTIYLSLKDIVNYRKIKFSHKVNKEKCVQFIFFDEQNIHNGARSLHKSNKNFIDDFSERLGLTKTALYLSITFPHRILYIILLFTFPA